MVGGGCTYLVEAGVGQCLLGGGGGRCSALMFNSGWRRRYLLGDGGLTSRVAVGVSGWVGGGSV